MNYSDRIDSLRDCLDLLDVDVFMISDLKNIRYLSGFKSTNAAILISATDAWLITDYRYADASEKIDVLDVITSNDSTDIELIRLSQDAGWKRIGFESDHLDFYHYQSLKDSLRESTLVPFNKTVENLRLLKTAAEIDYIREAASIAETALLSSLKQLKHGVIENEIAAFFDYEARCHGAEGVSFDTIVAFGPHSAIPHAVSGDRRLQTGDTIKIDCGAVKNGYCSDLTRTFFWESAPDVLTRAYDCVNSALEAAISIITPGITLSQVDNKARDIIDASEFSGLFTHGLGHGLGIDVHELPGVNKASSEVAKTGMVFTIEPGIYIPGTGGVRIEDMVVVKDEGCEVLTSLPRELLVLSEGKI